MPVWSDGSAKQEQKKDDDGLEREESGLESPRDCPGSPRPQCQPNFFPVTCWG